MNQTKFSVDDKKKLKNLVEFEFFEDFERKCLRTDIFKKTLFHYVFDHSHSIVNKTDQQTELENKIKNVFDSCKKVNIGHSLNQNELFVKCRIFYFCKTVSLMSKIVCYCMNLDINDWNERLFVLMNTSLADPFRTVLPSFNKVFKQVLVPYNKFREPVACYGHLDLDLTDQETLNYVMLMDSVKIEFGKFVLVFLEKVKSMSSES